MVLFLNRFDLLIILNKSIELAIVVVHYFNFICSFINTINVGSQVFLKSLQIRGRVEKVFNRKCIADWIDDLMILLILLDCWFVKGPPVKVEDNHDQNWYYISSCYNVIGETVTVADIA